MSFSHTIKWGSDSKREVSFHLSKCDCCGLVAHRRINEGFKFWVKSVQISYR